MALRVIPILDSSGIEAFLRYSRNEFGTKEAYLVASYALPEGKNYLDCETFFENNQNEPGLFTKRSEDGFITFLNYNKVHQTFSSENDFNSFADDCGFKPIGRMRAVEEGGSVRNVVVLTPTNQTTS